MAAPTPTPTPALPLLVCGEGHPPPSRLALDLPTLRALADLVTDLGVVVRVVAADGWGDGCSSCPEPRDGGPEQPHDAVAHLRRLCTLSGAHHVREPACAVCLHSAIRWEQQHRASSLVAVELIAHTPAVAA